MLKLFESDKLRTASVATLLLLSIALGKKAIDDHEQAQPHTTNLEQVAMNRPETMYHDYDKSLDSRASLEGDGAILGGLGSIALLSLLAKKEEETPQELPVEPIDY